MIMSSTLSRFSFIFSDYMFDPNRSFYSSIGRVKKFVSLPLKQSSNFLFLYTLTISISMFLMSITWLVISPFFPFLAAISENFLTSIVLLHRHRFIMLNEYKTAQNPCLSFSFLLFNYSLDSWSNLVSMPSWKICSRTASFTPIASLTAHTV